MTSEDCKEWVLPASIPFQDLKAKDLEECVYWLFDAMGAKDLEWRVGGEGGGAADGGRDLEARLSFPGDDGELVTQKWWIECKGRTRTVEASEVKAAINNSLAFEGVDFLIIATNTQFSNPTRDWVNEWQRKHKTPKIQLWDKEQLERYLSRYPHVVLRLFSQALSLSGRLQAIETRFWNRLEFVAPQILADIWMAKSDLDLNELNIFALVANEFASGDITQRPWGAVLNQELLINTIGNSLHNAYYLFLRSNYARIESRILVRSFAYFVLAAIEKFPVVLVVNLIFKSITREQPERVPAEMLRMLLMPIANQLLSEMQDVCSSDCGRITCFNRNVLTSDNDEVENYWSRFEADGLEEQRDTRNFRLEKMDAPCQVGFDVNEDQSCPLFEFEPSIENMEQLLSILQRVASFRKAQAASKRKCMRTGS